MRIISTAQAIRLNQMILERHAIQMTRGVVAVSLDWKRCGENGLWSASRMPSNSRFTCSKTGAHASRFPHGFLCRSPFACPNFASKKNPDVGRPRDTARSEFEDSGCEPSTSNSLRFASQPKTEWLSTIAKGRSRRRIARARNYARMTDDEIPGEGPFLMRTMHADDAINRRAVLKLSGVAGAGVVAKALAGHSSKSVIVIGAGMAGLSCAYELTRRGHQVIVLEASGRPGGHVRTLHDPFADGLYADMGAEHFYYPGYTQYWRYLHEFGLTAIHFPKRDNLVRFLRGERFSETDLQSRAVLGRLGFNQREIAFLADRPWADFPLLYIQSYVDRFRDETNPFGDGLEQLDHITVRDFLKRENASAAAVELFGGSGSALQMIWGAGIKKLRGTDLETKKLFRLKGGNQLMTDSFAARLGEKVHLGCPVTGIQHGPSGATVRYREFGQERKMNADYLVSCISLVMLRQLPVTPAWPEAKAFVIREMPYYTRTRIVFQCRTRFWKTDNVSPNWLPPDPRLNELWSLADEVNTPRGILIGGAQAGVSASQALEAFHKLYLGKSGQIEQTIAHDWSKEPWSSMCERIPYRLGELARFWPEVIRPCGRIHFAGAYAAQMNWGQEAALESANRAAEAIDRA